MTVGIMMMALGLSGTVRGAIGIVFVGLGFLLLATGTVGRCLLYRAFGWTTAHEEAHPIPSS
jgi:hypothetical protein